MLNQQGDIIKASNQIWERHKGPTVDLLVLDGDNKVVLTNPDSNLLCYPCFFDEPKTLKAGFYTIIIRPAWR
jgi:hypothetical protein